MKLRSGWSVSLPRSSPSVSRPLRPSWSAGGYRLSIAWFGILSLCVLLASGGLLMKSEVLAHLYLWLVLEVAAALFVVPFVVVPIVVWGFLWAARIVVLCAFLPFTSSLGRLR